MMGDSSTNLKPVESGWSLASTLSPIHEVILVAIVCMGQFRTQTNIGVCLSPLDIVGDSFDVDDPGILSWFMAGYSLTVGTFILVSGRCGVLFGYRPTFTIGFCALCSGPLLQVSASA